MDGTTIFPLILLLGFVAGIAFAAGRFTRQTPTQPEKSSELSNTADDLLLRILDQPDMHMLLERSGEWLHRTFDHALIVIYQYNFATHELFDPIVVGGVIPNIPRQLRLGATLYGEVARNRIPRLVERVEREIRFGATLPEIRTARLAPIAHQSVLFGVVAVQSKNGDFFTLPRIAEMDRGIAIVSMACALLNRISETTQAISQFERFQQLAQRLTTRLESKQLLQEIVDAAREMLDTSISILMSVDLDDGHLSPMAWSGMSAEAAQEIRSRYKEDLKGLVAWAKRPARSPDIRTDLRSALAKQSAAAGMLSELAVPVLYNDKLYGILAVQTDIHRHFTDEEMYLLSSLAANAGSAIRNAQLFEQLQYTNSQLEQAVADLVISQQQTENARAAAVQANRFKTEFINNMSHELRTPLNAVINFTRIVMDGHVGAVTPEQKQYLTYVHDSGQHLLGLINDILDLAKIEAGRMDLVREHTDLESLMKGVMSTAVGLTRSKGLALKTEFEPGLPHMMIDARRIRQVMLNLISNAAKFTEKGGLTLRVRRDGEAILVSLQDTGVGIKQEDIAKVFEEFRQIDNPLQEAAGGTGLGMAISRRFVQLHGGDMWVESTIDVGTTVFFTLPLSEQNRVVINGTETDQQDSQRMVEGSHL
jgi:signal transduction histidine kinase